MRTGRAFMGPRLVVLEHPNRRVRATVDAWVECTPTNRVEHGKVHAFVPAIERCPPSPRQYSTRNPKRPRSSSSSNRPAHATSLGCRISSRPFSAADKVRRGVHSLQRDARSLRRAGMQQRGREGSTLRRIGSRSTVRVTRRQQKSLRARPLHRSCTKQTNKRCAARVKMPCRKECPAAE